MASAEHQNLLNSLALALEQERGVTITHLDIDGTPEYFDAKYKNLNPPKQSGGHVPDLEGSDASGLIHLGEAKTDIMGDSNIDSQLRAFSNLQMSGDGRAVPLHIVIPKALEADLRQKLNDLGLDNKIGNQITIWT